MYKTQKLNEIFEQAKGATVLIEKLFNENNLNCCENVIKKIVFLNTNFITWGWFKGEKF